MKLKTAIGFLAGLLFSLLLLSPGLSAEAPKYDATGTWAYELTKRWDTCSPDSTFDDSGNAVLTQAGNSITLYISKELKTLYGKVEGNRYWVSQWAETQSGKKNEQAVLVLQSSTIGSGHFLGGWSDGQSLCNWGGNLKFTKLLSSGCQPSDTVMCLQKGRFSVSVTWRNQQGQTGVGHAVPSTDDSGLFWFFSESNMELLIKVLNACGTPSKHYWVFFAATTDQEFTVTVTDTKTMEVVEYTNPLKNPADAVTDTSAFATCP